MKENPEVHYTVHGAGREKAIVLHDWAQDSTGYNLCLPFIDAKHITYLFMDLRGYGQSKAVKGNFTVEEIANDVLSIADSLKWERFHLVCHSMTGLAGEYLTAAASKRLKTITLIAPVLPGGSEAPDEVMAFLEDAARNNDASAIEVMSMLTGGRYSDAIYSLKVEAWRRSSTAEARVAYLKMFATANIKEKMLPCQKPLLLMAGAHDMESARGAILQKGLMPWYRNIELKVIEGSGHYPMQEAPMSFMSELNRFITQHQD